MANNKKFVVKNGLHTQNIDFVSPSGSNSVDLFIDDQDSRLQVDGGVLSTSVATDFVDLSLTATVTPATGRVWYDNVNGVLKIAHGPADVQEVGDGTSENTTVVTTNFGGILSSADTDVQLALDTIDDHGHAIYKYVAVSGQDTLTASAVDSTLTIVSAGGITLTTNDTTNSLTISSSQYSHPTQTTISVDATNDGVNVIDAIQVNDLGHVTSVTTRNLSVATTIANGVMSSGDKTKLDGIESGATADMTATEILTAIKTVDGVDSGLDADLLDGQNSSYYQVALGYTAENTANKNQASGYAGLDTNGKLDANQLPSIAITDTFVVATQVAMLALTAETGDVAVRTDLSKSFILQGTDPSVLGNWQELLTPVDTIQSITGSAPVSVSGGANPQVSMAAATASVNGYMTSVYAAKLDGIAASANNYSHPTQTAIDVNATDDGISVIDRVQVNTLGHVTAVSLRNLSAATTSANGVMSSTDKTKLDGINAATVLPQNPGTATIGVSTSYARQDHVHALQTTVSGNAGTATTLQTARTINGVSFNGSIDIVVTANTTQTLTRGTGLTGSNFNGSAATTWDVSYGTAAGTACQGNDSRLSDARTPTSHDNTYHSTAYTPEARTLTINGTALSLAANRSWSVGTVTSVTGGDGLSGTITSTGSLAVDATVVRTSGTQYISGQKHFLDASDSTDASSGAITVAGGVGVGGDVNIDGSLTATSKSFLIDHPTKPDMKLRYGSLEGPENGVYMRGRLDGINTIYLPDYWTELVDESTITISITPIGSHQELYVHSIRDNIVVISGRRIDEIKCFYTVFAERKDIDRLQVEI